MLETGFIKFHRSRSDGQTLGSMGLAVNDCQDRPDHRQKTDDDRLSCIVQPQQYFHLFTDVGR